MQVFVDILFPRIPADILPAKADAPGVSQNFLFGKLEKEVVQLLLLAASWVDVPSDWFKLLLKEAFGASDF